ncbi:MAG TPA: MaoC/PaaZ C-terminal domain-containing protein, partial [Acidimicrobiales bacterium]|nr:MaoC/PaaZ C-terminal domain-containing protein [Acidimicrobiales bacterium]
SIELLAAAIPTDATITTTSTLTAIYDKGSGALVRWEATSVNTAAGSEPLFSVGTGLFIRGEGGFGGDRGPSTGSDPIPSRPPDEVVTYTTQLDQALLYRLSGDRNPLHSDPTFAAVVGAGGAPRSSLGSFDPAMLVHAEQSIELFGAAIPTGATIRTTSSITAIYDKGSGALVRSEATSVNAASGGEPLFRIGTGLFIRGEGGFGGDRGPSAGGDPFPSRPPDEVVTYTTRPDQALLYRLSGDRNPLHSDPSFAKRAGFDRPILHGLCTYGFVGRALLHTLCGSEPGRFRSMYGRFSRPTYPGDTLTTSLWIDGVSARFRTENQSGETVIDAGTCQFS